MERTIIAFSLMALLVLAGLWIGIHLRRNSRQRFEQRRQARGKFQRQARAVAVGRE
jgi:ABC-type bacteriocin/lantibiotic exporter with double-glycine peptidase domain